MKKGIYVKKLLHTRSLLHAGASNFASNGKTARMKEKRSSGLLASTVNPAPNIQGKLGQRNSTPFWWLAAGGNRPFNLPPIGYIVSGGKKEG